MAIPSVISWRFYGWNWSSSRVAGYRKASSWRPQFIFAVPPPRA